MGKSRRWRVHVQHWDGQVNFFVDSLEEAWKLREKMFKKHYVMDAHVSEYHGPVGQHRSDPSKSR